mmetsp:Transcript_27239/g.87775  ORF Transcript_27239/g.87775 Transcript_27239/m.87775 type:complete len:267 (+) Transcript_27239:702-1502(+)
MSSLTVNPPSLWGSSRSTMASTCTPSSISNSANTSRMPSVWSTTPRLSTEMAANASATRECEAKQRSLRSSRTQAGAKKRMPFENSSGVSSPSPLMSTIANRSVVSESVSCTLDNVSRSIDGVWACRASSCTAALLKALQTSLAEMSLCTAAPLPLVLDLRASRPSPRPPPGRPRWPPLPLPPAEGGHWEAPPPSSLSLGALSMLSSEPWSPSSASAMLRKRCLTFLRMSSKKRLGSDKFMAVTNSRREITLLLSQSMSLNALVAS